MIQAPPSRRSEGPFRLPLRLPLHLPLHLPVRLPLRLPLHLPLRLPIDIGRVAGVLAFLALIAACTGAPASPSQSPTAATQSPPAASTSPSPAPTFPLTLTDDKQSQVVIPARPARIVSLSPAATETVFALDEGARVVGKVQDVADYPPEAHSIPEVATYTGVDIEKIVALRTDLVLVDASLTKPDTLQRLRDVGIPVVQLLAADVDAVLADIRLIGRAIDADGRAADLVASMRAQIDQIAAATAALPHPRTFYEIDATKEIYGPTVGSPLVDLIVLAGGQPITTGSTTVASISLEKLVTADPEVIVLGDAAYGVKAEDVARRPGWTRMTAVRSRAIRPVNDIVITRPGPRLVEGLRDLAGAIHPELVLAGQPSSSAGLGSPATSASPSGA
jgi:iron complex transport system substrate-binding protein